MRRYVRFVAWGVLGLVMVSCFLVAFKPELRSRRNFETGSGDEGLVYLPKPRVEGSMSVEEAIQKRRSIREYSDEPMTLEQLSQVLWAAQGITNDEWKLRAAPSAGATYPFDIYVVVSRVRGLEPGVYRYDPYTNSLKVIRLGKFSSELGRAALDQEWVRQAAVNLVLVATYDRTTKVYGDRGIRYVHMEAGHIAQNVYLQTTAMGLEPLPLEPSTMKRLRGSSGAPGGPST